MNYSTDEHEYAELQAQFHQERMYAPCDIHTGACMLVDEASPDEPVQYFRHLNAAVCYAQDNDYLDGQWSVWKVRGKIM